MDWSIEITRVDNGYTVGWYESGDDDEMLEHHVVFEETDEKHGDIACMVKLLWFVTEHFGMTGSKHDEKRIGINTDGQSG